jgi:hypothetical protein
MKQYIDKVTVVAEIDRLQEATMDKNQNFLSSYHEGIFDGLSMLENFLDTLDTKEVEEEAVSKDLEREIKHYVYDPYFDLNGVAVKGATDYLTVEDVADIARHFAQWQKKQEAKKMDIEKEFDDYTKDILACDIQFEPFTHLHNCAKHFFELGLKAKGE